MPKKASVPLSNWFVCTIGKSASHNWQICKENGIWGIPTSGRKFDLNQTKKGDFLIFYLASIGFLGVAKVSGPMKVPSSKEEAPWAGGIYRYGVIVPFSLKHEVENPLRVEFENNKVKDTNLSTNLLRKGYSRISKEDGQKILRAYFPDSKNVSA